MSTVAGLRWRDAPSLSRYLTALEHREKPPRENELIDDATRLRERLMLGLRLDEPVALAEVESVLDRPALERLVGLGMVICEDGLLTLTRHGRFLGGAVSADLIIWPEDLPAASKRHASGPPKRYRER